ncbi:OLC1v1016187C7 [Oldenlandia corymbosa var. corymbosa]|uniref:OLC1v1016187C7 n=1 Tax=Oldenlandia corymbosa var. corymbosa TaxID=529605 RepID=A0AAV1E6S7_OLDCO|nr:OLC1v1016187C7 [Oldenlandia corymbosa var. corymbosa]
MDKEDVQMEEAETQSHKGLDSGIEASEDGVPGVKEASGDGGADVKKVSEDGVSDGEEPKLAHLQEPSSTPAVTDDNKKSHEIGNEDGQPSVDDTVVKKQGSATIEPQEQSHPKFQKGKEGGVETEVGDQIKGFQGIQPEEEIKDIKEAKQETSLPATETATKDESDVVSAIKDQSSAENGKQDEGARDNVMADETTPQIAVEEAKNQSHDGELPFQLPVSEVPPKKKEALDEAHQIEGEKMVKGLGQEVHPSETVDLVKKELDNQSVLSAAAHDKTLTQATKHEVGDSSFGNKRQPVTPDFPLRYSSRRSAAYSVSGEAIKNVVNNAKITDNEDGTPEQQAAFLKELENFYRQRGVEFKQPKFYGQLLNLYKLWTSVVKLGGYDLVTGTKLWRQIGESFNPPKTCTTVSWTFRIFYEKSLLEYEKFKVQNGDIELPSATLAEPSSADNEGNGYQAPGSTRARRDAAARAMQGWHSQKLHGYGEEKSPNSMQKRENKVKSIGSLKQKRPNEPELPVKTQRTETSKQLSLVVTSFAFV